MYWSMANCYEYFFGDNPQQEEFVKEWVCLQQAHWQIAGQMCISSAFARCWAVVLAESTLLSNRIKISTFCSFTGLRIRQKVINCPAIANAGTLAVMLKRHHDYDTE